MRSPVLRRIVVATSGCRARTLESSLPNFPWMPQDSFERRFGDPSRQRNRGNVPNRWICVKSDTQEATPQSIRMAFS